MRRKLSNIIEIMMIIMCIHFYTTICHYNLNDDCVHSAEWVELFSLPFKPYGVTLLKNEKIIERESTMIIYDAFKMFYPRTLTLTQTLHKYSHFFNTHIMCVNRLWLLRNSQKTIMMMMLSKIYNNKLQNVSIKNFTFVIDDHMNILSTGIIIAKVTLKNSKCEMIFIFMINWNSLKSSLLDLNID
jgi:hypothetical protein